MANGSVDAPRIFDLWDSREAFEALGATLMPILGKHGADAGEPEVQEAHNIIAG